MRHSISRQHLMSKVHARYVGRAKSHGRRGRRYLVEMIVVLAIIAVVAALIVPNVIGRPDQARVTVADDRSRRSRPRSRCTGSTTAVYPTTAQGLAALVDQAARARRRRPNWAPGGYLEQVPADPWGQPYVYRSPGRTAAGSRPDVARQGRQAGRRGPDADLVGQAALMRRAPRSRPDPGRDAGGAGDHRRDGGRGRARDGRAGAAASAETEARRLADATPARRRRGDGDRSAGGAGLGCARLPLSCAGTERRLAGGRRAPAFAGGTRLPRGLRLLADRGASAAIRSARSGGAPFVARLSGGERRWTIAYRRAVVTAAGARRMTRAHDRRRASGFSLIEALVALAGVAIAAWGYPRDRGARRFDPRPRTARGGAVGRGKPPGRTRSRPSDAAAARARRDARADVAGDDDRAAERDPDLRRSPFRSAAGEAAPLVTLAASSMRGRRRHEPPPATAPDRLGVDL